MILTQDITWESNKKTVNITNKSQALSPFPAGDQTAAMNRRESMRNTRHKKHKWSSLLVKLEMRPCETDVPSKGHSIREKVCTGCMADMARWCYITPYWKCQGIKILDPIWISLVYGPWVTLYQGCMPKLTLCWQWRLIRTVWSESLHDTHTQFKLSLLLCGSHNFIISFSNEPLSGLFFVCFPNTLML